MSADRHGALDHILDQGFQLGAGELDIQMLRPAGVGGNEGQVDVRLGRAGQFDLGLLRGLFEALQGELVLAQVDALVLFELGGQVVDDLGVEILAAQEGVAIG